MEILLLVSARGGEPSSVLPSLDLLHGRVVRLTHGDFATARTYGAPEEVLDALEVPRGARLHWRCCPRSPRCGKWR